MIYTVTWGKRICESGGWGRGGRASDKIKESEQLGEKWIEADSLTNAKKRATRHVNTLPEIKGLFSTLSKDKKCWKTWKPDIDGIDGIDKYSRKITYTSKKSERIYGKGTQKGTYLVLYVTISWERLERR